MPPDSPRAFYLYWAATELGRLDALLDMDAGRDVALALQMLEDFPPYRNHAAARQIELLGMIAAGRE